MAAIETILLIVAIVLAVIAIIMAATGRPWVNAAIGAVVALVVWFLFGALVH